MVAGHPANTDDGGLNVVDRRSSSIAMPDSYWPSSKQVSTRPLWLRVISRSTSEPLVQDISYFQSKYTQEELLGEFTLPGKVNLNPKFVGRGPLNRNHDHGQFSHATTAVHER